MLCLHVQRLQHYCRCDYCLLTTVFFYNCLLYNSYINKKLILRNVHFRHNIDTYSNLSVFAPLMKILLNEELAVACLQNEWVFEWIDSVDWFNYLLIKTVAAFEIACSLIRYFFGISSYFVTVKKVYVLCSMNVYSMNVIQM